MNSLNKFKNLYNINNVRTFHMQLTLANKTYNKEAKVLRKLFGDRLSGSKRRWYPNEVKLPQVFEPKFNTRKNKNDSKRVNVLNKLFMTHVTDLLATGAISDDIVGKGLQITRVKISSDFHIVNVFWMSNQDPQEMQIVLDKCSGLLRHELSKLRLMGVVPLIHFVKDKASINLEQIQSILKEHKIHNDVLTDETEDDEIIDIKPKKIVMTNDTYGLNYEEMMNKVLGKLKKSSLAWEAHKNKPSKQTIGSTTTDNEKDTSTT